MKEKNLKLQDLNDEFIKNKIHTIRWFQVMLDRDLAELYQVETRVLNQAVKRNFERFNEEIFMFQLNEEEFENLISQFVISSKTWWWVRKLPFVFTEQGIYMLATVLKSKVAVEITKQIMKTFVNMKKFLFNNDLLFHRIEKIEKRQIMYEINTDNKINKIFKAIESKNIKPEKWIFYNWQIYDSYVFVNDLLKNTKKEVILIDNYIDDTVLTLFSKYPKLNFVIITKKLNKQQKLDIEKYNLQYKNLQIKINSDFHDRFLVLDKKEVYHLWASLKDLWKKIFGFSKIEYSLLENVLSKYFR